MTYEFKNLLWQKIIERKIHNRYLCLKYREINKEKCDEIDALSKSVKPGDTTNREAVAARKYFVAFENCDTLFETLTYSNRKSLIDLPNQIILQSDKRMRIRYAIEIYVKSLVSAIENNNVSLLEIPELIPFDIFFEDEDD